MLSQIYSDNFSFHYYKNLPTNLLIGRVELDFLAMKRENGFEVKIIDCVLKRVMTRSKQGDFGLMVFDVKIDYIIKKEKFFSNWEKEGF